jgi:hypothetical protein
MIEHDNWWMQLAWTVVAIGLVMVAGHGLGIW